MTTLSRTLAALALLQLAGLTAEAQQSNGWPAREIQGNLVRDGIPPVDPQLQARLERYLHSRRATFLDWLPDGGMLVATRFGEIEQIHRVAAPLQPPAHGPRDGRSHRPASGRRLRARHAVREREASCTCQLTAFSFRLRFR